MRSFSFPRAALALSAFGLLILGCSCSSLRNGGGDDDGGDDGDKEPPRLSERIANFDRNKEFDKKSLDIYKTYSDAPKEGYQTSSFRSKRFEKIQPFSTKEAKTGRYNTERFNTERFQAGSDQEKKKRWFFRGDRNKEKKQSMFSSRRSRDDTEVFATRRFPDQSNINALIGNRQERDVSSRWLKLRGSAAGDLPQPTVIRERTLSDGGIRALLNGP